MEKNLQPKSFRIDEQTAEKLREISSNIGGNHQEAFSKLIEAYELQQGKMILKERREDIERFEKYAGILVQMYMNALEDNQNVTDLVRTEFDAQLRVKEGIIKDLQDKADSAIKEMKEYQKKYKELEKENKLLQEKNEQLQIIVSDKDALNASLLETIENQKELISVFKAEKSKKAK